MIYLIIVKLTCKFIIWIKIIIKGDFKKFQTTSIGENYVPGLPYQYDFGRMNLHAHFAPTT